MDAIYIGANATKVVIWVLSTIAGLFGAIFLSRQLLRRQENQTTAGVQSWKRKVLATAAGFLVAFLPAIALFPIAVAYLDTRILSINRDYRCETRTVLLWDSEYGFVSPGVMIDNRSGAPLKLCTLTASLSGNVSATTPIDIPDGKITKTEVSPAYICHDSEQLIRHYTNPLLEHCDTKPLPCLLTPAVFSRLPLHLTLPTPESTIFTGGER